ncbi:MAG TPA: GNAT family N-acetyltransferase [Polyangiaceae bacterium]|nr:GNAT family N-acetyltransferase [Polyangiaceae bacterium]
MNSLDGFVRIRTATFLDVPRLVELNALAYPDLIEDGVVFDAAQFESHIERFPEGQIVAEQDGVVAGALATLILPPKIDALAQHTWMGVTDGGTFERHDPTGRTLYLADIYVAPAFWGRGTSRALYAALFDACRRLRCDHVIAGGRLWGYADVATDMTADEYVRRVVRGELRDRVLQSQLRAGFAVRGILRGYLHDWRSLGFATLLEWQNPERRGAATTPRQHRPSWPVRY